MGQDPFSQALNLLISLDKEVYFIAWTSLKFSIVSTMITAIPATIVGMVLALKNFCGKRGVVALLNSMLAMPTVVLGLMVYSLLSSRTGLLGHLNWLFTPSAVILGQALLCFPLITSMIFTSIKHTDPILGETLITLGASPPRRAFVILWERKSAVLTAILAGFGRVVGEVGISMMLGGNIRWYTRTMTTAIALETSKGRFGLGLSLGIILMAIALAINFLMHWLLHDNE